MKSRLIREEPFKQIIDREWARAKRLLPFYLKRKPRFLWADSERLNGAYGRCHRGVEAYILVHHDFKKLTNQKEFVLLLRHEFAHLPRPSYGQRSHGQDFCELNTRLGGTRYVSSTLTELRRREK